MLLDGKELDAFKCIKASSRFEGAKSVKLLSGRMYGGELYGFFAYTSRYGYSECEMYNISPSGYTRTVSITLYSLNDAERCLAEGYLDIDKINSTLEMHYGSPLSGLRGLAENTFFGGDHMFLTIVIIIIIIVLCLDGLLSSKASDIAQDKGYEKSTWFHMCFWLGPISFIIIAAMPDLTLRKKQDETISQLKQLIEHVKQDKTNSLLSELVECAKANQEVRSAPCAFVPETSIAPMSEGKTVISDFTDLNRNENSKTTHTSFIQPAMRRRGPVTTISQED